MRQHAAKIRPTLRVLFASLIILSLFSHIASADNNTPERRETAKAQFDRAEKDRQALEARPENARSLKDYTALVSTYKRVSLITAHAAEVPPALNQVAELYRTMGDLFDEKYYQLAIDSYQFLLREYPTSRYREEAMLAIARIEQDDLHDSVLAQNSFEQFLALHPRSTHAAEVRAALDKLNASNAPAKPAPEPLAVKDRSKPERAEGNRRANGHGSRSAHNRHKARIARRNHLPGRPRFRRLLAFVPGTRTPTRAS